MGTPAQVVPGYFVWQAPGHPVTVHLSLSVVDKLSAEVMSGFSVSSKRGAEIGGLLLGTIAGETSRSNPGTAALPGDAQDGAGHPAIVKVESFLAVPCEYRRGPSYLFTEDDGAVFEKAFSEPGVIGYFRSHTREGLALAPEDLEILEHFFPDPASIALLIKPFATIACAANFFIRDKGAFASDPALEFPLRRRDLAGDGEPLEHSFEREPPRPPRPPRPTSNGSREPSVEPAVEPTMEAASVKAPPMSAPKIAPTTAPRSDGPGGVSAEKSRIDPAEPAYAYATPAKPRLRRWYWIPLSFIFLLLGLFLGFQVALTVGSRVAGSKPDISLNLSVEKNGANLNVHWDRESSIIQNSPRGTLEIEDGTETKRVDLDYAQLHNGALIYRGSSSPVRFRLIVYPNDRVSVSESVEWK